MSSDTITSKVWSFCTKLRDESVGYGNYLEQCPAIEQNEKEIIHSLPNPFSKKPFQGNYFKKQL
jgi:hypothetical protein